jgi:hypothetical protein
MYHNVSDELPLPLPLPPLAACAARAACAAICRWRSPSFQLGLGALGSPCGPSVPTSGLPACPLLMAQLE